jgi:hypothetical protein
LKLHQTAKIYPIARKPAPDVLLIRPQQRNAAIISLGKRSGAYTMELKAYFRFRSLAYWIGQELLRRSLAYTQEKKNGGSD